MGDSLPSKGGKGGGTPEEAPEFEAKAHALALGSLEEVVLEEAKPDGEPAQYAPTPNNRQAPKTKNWILPSNSQRDTLLDPKAPPRERRPSIPGARVMTRTSMRAMLEEEMPHPAHPATPMKKSVLSAKKSVNWMTPKGSLARRGSAAGAATGTDSATKTPRRRSLGELGKPDLQSEISASADDDADGSIDGDDQDFVTSLEEYLDEDKGEITWSQFIPIKHAIWNWLPSYNVKEDLRGDVISGLSVGIMVIPQGMAHAAIAGLPPVMGLYAALVPLFTYACLGSSRHLAVGSGAVVALLVNTGVAVVPVPQMDGGPGCAAGSSLEFSIYCQECASACSGDLMRGFKYSSNAAGDCNDRCLEDYRWRVGVMIAFLAGLVQILLGLIHFGYIVNFFSGPVLNGFTFAAGCIILLGQVRHLFGFDIDEYQKPCTEDGLFGGPDSFSCVEPRAYTTVIKCIGALPSTNGPTIGLGLACCIILQGLRMAKQKYGGGKELWKQAIKLCGDFAALLVVLFSTIIAYLSRDIKNPIVVVGEVPKGLPGLMNPFDVPQAAEVLSDVIVSSVTIGLISFISSVAVAKKFATRDKYELFANQELLALGSANFLGSFCSSFAVQGSLSRTVVNGQNAKTQLASIISATVVLLGLLVLTPLLFYLPKCGLAAIIIIACRELLDYSPAVALWKDGQKQELCVMGFAFFFTLIIGVSYGILASIGVSVILVVQRSAQPPCGEMGRIPGGMNFRRVALADSVITYDKVLLYEFEGPLFFVNRVYFKDQLDRTITRAQAARGPLKYIILSMAAVTDVDSTGVKTLREILSEQKKAGAKVIFVDLSETVKSVFWTTGLTKELGVDSFYLSLSDAMEDAIAYTTPLQDSTARMNFSDVAKWLIENSHQSGHSILNSNTSDGTSAPLSFVAQQGQLTQVFDRWHIEHAQTLGKHSHSIANTFSRKGTSLLGRGKSEGKLNLGGNVPFDEDDRLDSLGSDSKGSGPLSVRSVQLDAEFVPEERKMRPSHIMRANVRKAFNDEDLQFLSNTVGQDRESTIFKRKKRRSVKGQIINRFPTGNSV
eukprot:CAMPEP_0182899580 /NCGR_PEP_ID=MMETSP0034_2-20130328/28151_1 /TAXON_ID=156128 /ORGANISM="Nephroselmis pyriformis, Strain CCMP717" /LENGTH=1061 /DNA_ID=CAMNT_0025033617 /DNA_START=187 /DNA_END=3372 /DNA_ORIENTATION=-